LGLADGGDGDSPEQARLVSARAGGVRFISAYVPNGQSLGSEKYAYKMEWFNRLNRWLALNTSPGEPLALCGDFNVAPEARDVHDPAQWEATVLYAPEVRARLETVRAFGFTDAFRLHQQGNVYSWWDYRAGSFPRDNGLRIDHIWATASLAARCTAAEVDREERAGTGASDHAPVLATFAESDSRGAVSGDGR
jgi:exodeoxyribonuclease-3